MNRDFKNETRRLEANELDDEAIGFALRSLPRAVPDPRLRSSLRVMASREQRRAQGRAIAFADRLRLFSQNLMRPLALPAAGGIFSAVLLFSISFGPASKSSGFDVPIPPSLRGRATVLNSDPSVVKMAPISVLGDDNVIVDVTINGQGAMVDYTIVGGDAEKDEALERRIGTVLLLTKFNPATTLGAPHEGKIRLSLSAATVKLNVKG